MRPYYEQDGATVYCGDCREIVPTLAGDFAIVSDPPYGMNWDTNMTRFTDGSGKFTDLDRRNRGQNLPQVRGDSEPFDPSPWLDFSSVVLWGVNHFAQRVPVGTWLVWLKKPAARYGTFLSDAEVAWRKGGHGVYAREFQWEGLNRAEERGQHYHPTQKPVAIMRWCIEMSGTVTGPVLDPYAGCGTTLIAARHLGIPAIGIEIEERYCEIAAERLSQGVLDFGVSAGGGAEGRDP